MTERQIENWVGFAACLKEVIHQVTTAFNTYMQRVGLTMDQFKAMTPLQKEEANKAWRNSHEYSSLNQSL